MVSRGHRKRHSADGKAQTAMEYLTTYGWAILVIVLVLGLFIRLGIFANNGLGPKQFPTQCQVVRPLGPGTGTQASLIGACNSQVPEFVAQFNGATSFAKIPDSTTLQLSGPLTIVGWVYVTSFGAQQMMISKTGAFQIFTAVGTGKLRFGDTFSTAGTTASGLTSNTWIQVAAVWSGTTGTTPSNSNMQIYFNSSLQTISFIGSTWGGSGGSGNYLYVGTDGGSKFFTGSIADLQIYNVSLSQAQLQQLYVGGIGGPPIDAVNIVEWLPLNGDIRDYSGNANGGTGNAISYSTSWTTGYKPPP